MSARPKLVLAFQHMDRWNSWFLRLCSWICPVLIGRRSGGGVWAGSAVDLWYRGCKTTDLPPCIEKMSYPHIGWRFLRRHFKIGTLSPVTYESARLRLDYSPLLLKDIEDELITLVSIRAVARRLALPRPVYLGRLLWPKGGDKILSRAWQVRILQRFLVWCEEFRYAVLRLGLQGARLFFALKGGRCDFGRINTLWFGVCTNEYGKYGEKRSFYWPERVSSGLNILYVLSYAPDAKFACVLAEEKVRWVSQFHVLRFLNKSQLVRVTWKLFRALAVLPFPWRGSWTLRARFCGLHFDSIIWDEIARALPVKAAVTTCSTWTSTHPILTALRAAGVKTAIWDYSAFAVPFHHHGGKPHHNHGGHRAVHEAERIYVWSPHLAEWNAENLCHNPRNQLVPVGPVMCGNARLCLEKGWHSDGKFRIVIFDVSRVSGELEKKVGSLYIPAEYHDSFWKHMQRLLQDFQDTVLVVKPKRSVQSRHHAFSPAFFEILEGREWGSLGRVELIEDDADPYLAIAKADIAIGMPLTSPIFAAWHFNRIGIFYDPFGIVGSHLYSEMGRYFCKSYQALNALVQEVRQDKQMGRVVNLPREMVSYVSPVPMENPQETLLKDLSNWALDGSKTARTATTRVQAPTEASLVA